jgi:hypothetical protein
MGELHPGAPPARFRMDIERFVRWLQEVRRFQPSMVSRRLSIVVGFYRVCVIDGLLPHSFADYVRRLPACRRRSDLAACSSRR